MRFKYIVLWVLSLAAAAIMVQTLRYKFSGAEESVYIFTQLGMEPWGRYGVGVGELIASVLLLIPLTRPVGALMGIGLMVGAIYFHLFTDLGTVVQVPGATKSDGGGLFTLALITFVLSVLIVVIDYKSLRTLIRRVLGSRASA